MLADSSAFLALYPEFSTTGSALVTATLARAESQLLGPMEEHEDEMHGALTAHLLASAPEGQMSRSDPTKGTTAYLERFRELQRVTAAFRRMP